MKLIACSSNQPLAEAVAGHLGIPLTRVDIKRFADQEIFLEILENVRGEDVFILQSTSYPANDHMMEMLIMLDALRRGSAQRVTAVMPYFGYARQDRKTSPRSPISAKLVANLIASAGADRVLTIDLHASQIQGFFDIPVDNLYAGTPLFMPYVEKTKGAAPLVVVSPDVGGVVRARAFASSLDADLAIIDKRREKAGVSEVMNVIGDVKGKECILIDDMVDSAGTICNAAEALMKAAGAAAVRAIASHGVLSGGAVRRIEDSALTEMVVTDSIRPTEETLKSSKIKYISTARLLAEAISRIHNGQSVSSLFTAPLPVEDERIT